MILPFRKKNYEKQSVAFLTLAVMMVLLLLPNIAFIIMTRWLVEVY